MFRLLESGAVGDKALRDMDLPESLLSSLTDININQVKSFRSFNAQGLRVNKHT